MANILPAVTAAAAKEFHIQNIPQKTVFWLEHAMIYVQAKYRWPISQVKDIMIKQATSMNVECPSPTI